MRPFFLFGTCATLQYVRYSFFSKETLDDMRAVMADALGAKLRALGITEMPRLSRF